MVEPDPRCPVRQRDHVIDEHNDRLALPTIAARNFQLIGFKRTPLTKDSADVITGIRVNDDSRPLSGMCHYTR